MPKIILSKGPSSHFLEDEEQCKLMGLENCEKMYAELMDQFEKQFSTREGSVYELSQSIDSGRILRLIKLKDLIVHNPGEMSVNNSRLKAKAFS